ncbi:hypothetical protein AAY42_08620 [Flagellimonas eckloniae]|uniref:Uncharacterized protein n=1 Tax=Flagellimonas eckloniae TaxID=346185 RepID=A0A0Q1DLU1_9FLAO|nr:hypothetical protein AAY42_08620 [Allomuricauda eckloniae]
MKFRSFLVQINIDLQFSRTKPIEGNCQKGNVILKRIYVPKGNVHNEIQPIYLFKSLKLTKSGNE